MAESLLKKQISEIEEQVTKLKNVIDNLEDQHDLTTIFYIGFLSGTVNRVLLALDTAVSHADELPKRKVEAHGPLELGYASPQCQG